MTMESGDLRTTARVMPIADKCPPVDARQRGVLDYCSNPPPPPPPSQARLPPTSAVRIHPQDLHLVGPGLAQMRLGIPTYHLGGMPSLPLPSRSGTVPPSALVNGKRQMESADEVTSPPRPNPCGEDGGPMNGLDLVAPSRPRLVIETLAVLGKATPFDVRLKMDQTVIGRVLAFDAKPGQGQGAVDYELTVFVELPVGSGTVHGSDTIVRSVQHSSVEAERDFAKSLASGFKYLEYRLKPEMEDWKPLTDLLPDPVRCFKEPMKRELLPTPVLIDSILGFRLGRMPSSFHLLNVLHNKRKCPDPEAELMVSMCKRLGLDMSSVCDPIKRHLWMQTQAEALKITMNSSSSSSSAAAAASAAATDGHFGSAPIPCRRPSSPSPSHPVPVAADGCSALLVNRCPSPVAATVVGFSHPSPDHEEGAAKGHSPQASPGSAGHAGNVEPIPLAVAEVLRCTMCLERLEDTHFVQCPSVSDHKFCFPCSRESIKRQGAGAEVYCPSGKKCPLVGSSIPWAFMLNEIETILGEECSDAKIKKEKDST